MVTLILTEGTRDSIFFKLIGELCRILRISKNAKHVICRMIIDSLFIGHINVHNITDKLMIVPCGVFGTIELILSSILYSLHNRFKKPLLISYIYFENDTPEIVCEEFRINECKIYIIIDGDCIENLDRKLSILCQRLSIKYLKNEKRIPLEIPSMDVFDLEFQRNDNMYTLRLLRYRQTLEDIVLKILENCNTQNVEKFL